MKSFAIVALAITAGLGSVTCKADSVLSDLTVVRASATVFVPKVVQEHGSTTSNPISLRGGVMVNPRGAAIVGADIDLPQISLGSGWHGRADVDVIIKANLSGANSLTVATFDQLYYSANGASGHNVFWGGGVGALFGKGNDFDAKLVVGTELTNKFGSELNIHFNKRNTLVNLLGRMHF